MPVFICMPYAHTSIANIVVQLHVTLHSPVRPVPLSGRWPLAATGRLPLAALPHITAWPCQSNQPTEGRKVGRGSPQRRTPGSAAAQHSTACSLRDCPRDRDPHLHSAAYQPACLHGGCSQVAVTDAESPRCAPQDLHCGVGVPADDLFSPASKHWRHTHQPTAKL
jgi:hypothetical protein